MSWSLEKLGLSDSIDTIYRYLVWLLLSVAIVFGVKSQWADQGLTILESDQEGYYIYLPAFFVHGTFDNIPCKSGCTHPDPTSKLVQTKYTYGVALMQSPFFLMAHGYAQAFGNEDDGRSAPYRWSVLIAGLIYLAIGLTFLKKVLSRWFSKTSVILTIICIALGTNLFYYATAEPGMAHVYGFCLFSLFMFLVQTWSQKPSGNMSIFLSLIVGIAILVRPTNAIILIALPGLMIGSNQKFVERLNTIWKSRIPIYILLFTILFFLPQFTYWQLFSGKFLSYSYGNEGFANWKCPKILQVLFSHQNGLFIYSPIILLAILGWIPLSRSKPRLSWTVAICFGLATYAFASWWAWWFGGAFGHRAFIEFFILLSIPMAAFWEKIGTSNSSFKTLATYGVTIILIFANLRMSLLYNPPWDGPNWTWDNYLEIWSKVFWLT